MIQIANVPYRKIYSFSYFSDAMILKLILYGLSILLPFFMVFSVNNFYLSFTDRVTAQPTIVYDYHYHLTIQTNSNHYTYTTLYKNRQTKAISFSYESNQNLNTHTFTMNWPKSANERVKKVSIAIFMKYNTNTVKDGYGIVTAQGYGYDAADLNIRGTIDIVSGSNRAEDPPTTNLLSTYNYDIGKTLLALQKNYRLYLKSTSQYSTINMPNNLLKFSLIFKAPELVFEQENPTVLGQLIWSFTQYFPIACTFVLITGSILSFLLRQHILKRSLIHDKALFKIQ